jgi:hypothetical protein
MRLAASSRSVMSAVPVNRSRTGPYRDQALVLVVAEVLGQLRAWQAGRDLRNVVEEPPYLLDRLRDLEVAGDYQRSTALT